LIAEYDIICFASSNWEALWVNSQHLMSGLADKGHRILYIQNMGLRMPRLKSRDVKEAYRRIKGMLTGLRHVRENLWVFDPPSVPIHGIKLAGTFNAKALRMAIRHAARSLKFSKPVLWAFLPTVAPLIGQLNERLVVYHCVDDYSANPYVDSARISEFQNEILNKADLVFATNPDLAKRLAEHSDKVRFIGNVADAVLFAKAQEPGPIAPEIADLKPPIVGYHGNIAGYKIDLSILIRMSMELPDVNIVLVGPVGGGDPDTDIRPLLSRPNIHWVDRVDRKRLPEFLRAFDVCILPMRTNASTRSSFPLKFYECMAAGKPIVATNLSAFAHYADNPKLAMLADDSVVFVEMVKKALSDSGEPDDKAIRLEEAKRNSWEVRLPEIEQAVEKVLSEKEDESK